MIITRSPLRISFAGGGTDIPEFYENYGHGAVVSTSINRYVYVMLNRKFDRKVSVRYSMIENTERVEDLKHDLIRETLLYYGIHENVEIVIASEVPARGSGLGASSAMIVALCLALENFIEKKHPASLLKNDLAEVAAKIEIEMCKSPIGKQDHYASAIGGLNFLKFSRSGIHCDPFPYSDFISELERQSMLFYLNAEHDYHATNAFIVKTLHQQIIEMPEKFRTYELQRHNAEELWANMKYEVIERFMDHVNENWRLKRSLHLDITNDRINELIQLAYSNGATAAKVCGAGGGGFIYLMVPPDMQELVRRSMNGLSELHFKFDRKGAEVIFKDSEEYAFRKD